MIFTVTRVSYDADIDSGALAPCFGATWDTERREWAIEIGTLEELLALRKDCGNDLIIGESFFSGPSIRIYDGLGE